MSCDSSPSVPRRTSPVATNCAITVRARLVGIAKLRPMLPAMLPRGLKLAVLMPISSPLRLTSAPPELPGLIEASVWMKFWKPSPRRPLRPTADTMPEVTVWPMPNGLPTATTKSPTLSVLESASASALRFCAGIFITAMSVSGSEPTKSAFSVRPSASVIETSSAPSITWWLVSTRPLAASTITPEPIDSLMRSCDSSGNIRRNIGSLENGLTRTRCLACTLTTAGVTRASIGASEGIAWPPTEAGSAAAIGTVAAVAGVACAGACTVSRIAVAAKPPNAAARDRASRVLLGVDSGRIGSRFRGA